MTLSLVLKLIHILAAMWMVVGIIGRTVVQSRAGRSVNISEVQTLMPVASIFERAMVIPGSNAVLIAGLLTAWAQGWPILGFLQGGQSNWVLVSLLLFLTTIPLIFFIFLPKGKVFDKSLQSAVARGQVTDDLSRAFHDPVVKAAHIYELAAIIVITALMVLKPF
jgi:uncharacterized membrane protein